MFAALPMMCTTPVMLVRNGATLKLNTKGHMLANPAV